MAVRPTGNRKVWGSIPQSGSGLFPFCRDITSRWVITGHDENSNEDLLKALEKQIKYSKTKFEQMIDLSIYVKFISHLVVSLHSG
ncbi:unnamed protein product [Didymodactylos carnosus]|uniref:Uncharacterized protein n=1 Tax=Didymodactylos carnosus TaxID=1234261 RepID=A0A815IG83_9BILA|nr:unnamed protein product [Didymodactylos carnosus]CAF4252418.1 unnamed protein product [Didymodactylos carnosus]